MLRTSPVSVSSGEGKGKIPLNPPFPSPRYSSSGSANRGADGTFRDATGESGRDIGSEFDLDYTLKLNPHQTFRVGVGLFKPGRFVRNLDRSTKDQNFGYLQWSYSF